MKLTKVLVAYFEKNYNTLESVSETLKKNRISFRCVKREKLQRKDLRKTDLVITVGGDGTFLRTAHQISDTPVLAVSSGARYNEAFFSRASKENFPGKIKRILGGEFRMKKLTRLEASINGKRLPIMAINEVFAGNRTPYHTSRYELNVRGKKEFQKSSGVLIATKAGSSGWAKSAAKKKLAIPRGGFGYAVREPYFGRLTNPTLLHGCLSSGEKIRIKSRDYQGMVVMDSYEREFTFLEGDVLEIGVSGKPLNLIEFPD